MTYLFLNLGAGEIFLVVFVILIFFGSKRIPEFARTLGRGMHQIKDASQAIQNDITDSYTNLKKEDKDKPDQL